MWSPSHYAVCECTKSSFIKEKGANALLSK